MSAWCYVMYMYAVGNYEVSRALLHVPYIDNRKWPSTDGNFISRNF